MNLKKADSWMLHYLAADCCVGEAAREISAAQEIAFPTAFVQAAMNDPLQVLVGVLIAVALQRRLGMPLLFWSVRIGVVVRFVLG